MEESKTQVSQDILMDKYLEKKNRNKKITICFILAISLILIGIIMFMALYRVSIRPPFLTEKQPISYEIKIESKTNTFRNNETSRDSYDKISSAYDDTFAMPYMTALFTGQTGSYEIDYTSQNLNSIDSVSEISNSDGYLKVEFDSKLTLKDKNGEAYKSIDWGTGELTYDCYYIPLSQDEEFKEVTIIIPTYNGTDTKAKITKITLHANTSTLYEALQDIIK